MQSHAFLEPKSPSADRNSPRRFVSSGVEELVRAIVERLPPPDSAARPADAGGGPCPPSPFKALVFDSYYSPQKGLVLLVVVKARLLCKVPFSQSPQGLSFC